MSTILSFRLSLPPVSCAHTSASTPERGPLSANTAGRPSPLTPPMTATSAEPTPETRRTLASCVGRLFKTSRSYNTT